MQALPAGAEESIMETAYKVAGIDVHKRMLAVVITDAAAEGEFRFERRKFGTLASDLKELAEWLAAEQVQEAVMESTAQYWKPVWRQLEGQCRLELAQAQSNRARRGRKGDFRDAERLVRRHVARELILSFVPNPEQRLWRTLTRSKQQLRRDRVRLHSQLEALLEDCRIKLASCVSDLLGVSSWRMLGGWPRVRPIRRFWRRWRSRNCGPRRSSWRMPWLQRLPWTANTAKFCNCLWSG
jgi:transposase